MVCTGTPSFEGRAAELSQVFNMGTLQAIVQSETWYSARTLAKTRRLQSHTPYGTNSTPEVNLHRALLFMTLSPPV